LGPWPPPALPGLPMASYATEHGIFRARDFVFFRQHSAPTCDVDSQSPANCGHHPYACKVCITATVRGLASVRKITSCLQRQDQLSSRPRPRPEILSSGCPREVDDSPRKHCKHHGQGSVGSKDGMTTQVDCDRSLYHRADTVGNKTDSKRLM